MQRQQQGFTLIELVIVIVILGILSAFALPRFADLSGDAETASIEGARGSVKSASSIVRSKALAAGEGDKTADDVFSLEGQSIDLKNGYLAGSSVEGAAQLNDFEVLGSGSPYIITIDPAEADKPCFTYTDSTTSSGDVVPPDVSSVATMDDASTCDGTSAG